jgi:hypothetical protein
MTMPKLEPGYYTAVATETHTGLGPVKVQFGEAKTGTKQCAVNLEIIGEGPFVGQTIMWVGYLTADTVKRTLESLRYMGFKGDDISKINEQPLDQLVSIDVGESEYEGKVSLKVNWVNRYGAGQGFELKKPIEKSAMAKFAATLRSHLKAVPEVTGDRASSLKGPAMNGEDKGDAPTQKEIDDTLAF